MGDSKRSIKNKARVEGSIYASYLHRETTYFCSHTSTTSCCHHAIGGMKLNVKEMCRRCLFFNNKSTCRERIDSLVN